MADDESDRRPQIDLQGSGIFDAADITLDHSRITANTPEPQCYGF